MKKLTILTPAYNREKELHNLFNSLCRQNNKDFDWVIVDDGSTDNTAHFAEKCKKDADFEVIYYYKENGGKHTALNFALKKITTPLVFIVDSDDYLTDDAVAEINEKDKLYGSDNNLCGFSFLRQKPGSSEYLCRPVPKDGMLSTYCECRVNGGLDGDMAEVWYTDRLREFPFPEFPGEKFLGEDTVLVKLSGKYNMRFFNKAIYISAYLDDGLTRNRRRHNIQSPNGCVARAQAFLDADVDLKHKLKSMLQYFIYGHFAGRDFLELFVSSNHKTFGIICLLPAAVIYRIWKKQFFKRS
ncbi:MAG: glycosyltransferase family A protein [Eubacterium sp.]